jgi:heme/copper-type cytochrome/quinol oxidase subunit 3
MNTNEFSASTNKRLGQFFIFLACVFFGLICWAFISDHRFINSARQVTGEVIDVEKNGSLPTIKFITFEGKEIVFKPSSRSAFVKYWIGESVEILYSEDNPDKASINTWFHLWSNTWLFGIFFVIFSIFAERTLQGKLVWGPLKETRIGIDVR